MLVRKKYVVCKLPGLKYLGNLRGISARRNTFLDFLDAASSMARKGNTPSKVLFQGRRSSTRELLKTSLKVQPVLKSWAVSLQSFNYGRLFIRMATKAEGVEQNSSKLQLNFFR